MSTPIFPSTFGQENVEIVFHEEEQGEVTFIKGQGRVAGFAGTVVQSGEGSQIVFEAHNERGQWRKFTFINIAGKVHLFPVREDRVEEPLINLGRK